MTQPPVSRQVQSLEHLLGAPLLDRTSRTVHLISAGRSILPEARRILALAEEAVQLVHRIADGRTGSAKVGFTASAAYSILPRLVQACREAVPEVELSLREMVSGDQVQFLGEIHTILAMVRAGLGLAIVPETATHLRFEGVVLRPLRTDEPARVELMLAWSESNDNPVLPTLRELAQQVLAGED